MNILPTDTKQFADKDYWEKFFKNRDKPFEWYGKYEDVAGIIEHYMKVNDKIFQIGCGSSELAENLYDNGFRNVESIDTNTAVIRDQSRKNVLTRPELSFKVESATKVPNPDQSINIVIDKGTLDALYPNDFDDSHVQMVESMFNEVKRILTVNGRYLVISLLQNHILEKIVSFFRFTNQYSIRVHCCDGDVSEFPMPLFVVVITKFKVSMPMVLPIEYMQNNPIKVVKKIPELGELIDIMAGEREFNMFAALKTKNFNEPACMDICKLDGTLRYKMWIINNPPQTGQEPSMLLFLVPDGEENSFLYSTNKGREIIRSNCNVSRLLMLYKVKGQEYGDCDEINAEVRNFVMRLCPPNLRNGKIAFTTSRKSTEVVKIVDQGYNDITGAWRVADIKDSDDMTRQLIFDVCPNLIQTEVNLVKKKGKFSVDVSVLNSQYHYAFVAGLAFVDNQFLKNRESVKLRLGVLGVGGGVLCTFLHNFFPTSTIVGVDLDRTVVDIGHKHFKLPSSDRMKIFIEDAIDFVDREATEAINKYDAIYIDIAGAISDAEINCPPICFLDKEFLGKIKKILTDKGVLCINVVSRDNEMHANLQSKIQEVFSKMYQTVSENDVNQVIICPMSSIYISQTKIPTLPQVNATQEAELSILRELNNFTNLT
uniref:Methyltransf_11 domain-containing protein n=1 Tax=Rhabditophanes sp. KR3021 TaxID=114890 RepID=A0AC35TMP5_9BILA